MRRFTDNGGKSWTIELSVGAIGRVKSLSDGRFNLWEPDRLFSDGKSLQATLLLDFSTLAEVLWLLICQQAESASVTAEQFAESLGAEAILSARDAFFGEWRDFFQNLQRPDQAMSLEKTLAWVKVAQQKLAAAVTDERVVGLDRKVLNEMDQALKDSLGKLPAC